MGYWSVYVAPDDEKALRSRIEKIAEKKRWSFSQAVMGILREHLLEEKERLSDEAAWQILTTQAFFDGYSEKDNVYDSL